MAAETLVYNLNTPNTRNTKHIPSLNSGAAVAAKVEPKVYTGSSVLGISTLHKSNLVPVFSKDEAVAIARMRR